MPRGVYVRQHKRNLPHKVGLPSAPNTVDKLVETIDMLEDNELRRLTVAAIEIINRRVEKRIARMLGLE